MKDPKCHIDGPHRAHNFVIQIGGLDLAAESGRTDPLLATDEFEQRWCPGEPEPEPPLHGHGGGPRPDACDQCFTEGRWNGGRS